MAYIKHSETANFLMGKFGGHNNLRLEPLLFSRVTQRATKHSLFNLNTLGLYTFKLYFNYLLHYYYYYYYLHIELGVRGGAVG